MSKHTTFCQNQTVLVTGGTRGFGKAIALEFMAAGAKDVFVTHKWGSIDEEELKKEFENEGLKAPVIIQSDIGDREETLNLMKTIQAHCPRLDVIISNVAFSKKAESLQDWKRQALEISLRYSAWSVMDLLQTHQEVMNSLPRYLIGISSDGPDICHPGYGLMGTAKAALETMCRYLAILLRKEGTRINVVRPGYFETDSSRAAFGEEIFQHAYYRFLNLREGAKVCVALCSGLMDSVIGEVITVDEGQSLISPLTNFEQVKLMGKNENSNS